MKKNLLSILMFGAITAASPIALAESVTISRNPDTADNNLDTLSARASESWNFYSKWYSPEKLFLHIDRAYYAIGETIWFTGYLTNALPQCSKEMSNYIYVELINEKGACVQREKVKAQESVEEGNRNGAWPPGVTSPGSQNNGGELYGTGSLKKADAFKIFPGQIEISDALSSGIYTIRAYTKWQLNGQTDILFTQKIRIKGDKQLKNKSLPVENLAVDFYPESGRYFAGEKSVIGFKVTDAHGRNVEISGRLVCESVAGRTGAQIIAADVHTSHDGMGIINFTPEAGCRYFLELQGAASQSVAASGRFELPEPATEGVAIHVNNLSNAVYISFQAKGLSSDCCLYLRSQSGIRALKIIEASTSATNGIQAASSAGSVPGQPVGSVSVSATSPIVLPSKQLESGVNHLIVADRGGKVLAERLFFVYRQVADSMKGSFSTEKSQYGRRDRIRSIFSLKDALGRPVKGQFSVSVVRGAFEGFVQESDITSYLAIESELTGAIHNPQYYFSESVPIRERRSNLDLLMMVQGWRYYDMEKILGSGAVGRCADNAGAGAVAAGVGGTSVFGVEKAMNGYFGLKYGRELTQSISGKVTSSFGKKKTKEYDLNILIPSQNAVRSVRVDGGNGFFIDSLDFQNNTGFIVSSVKSKGIGVYRPTWDEETFAPPLKLQKADGKVVDLSGMEKKLSAGVGGKTTATANGSVANLEIKSDSYNGELVDDFIIDSLADVVVSARVEPDIYKDEFSSLENKIASQKDLWDNRPIIDFLLAMESVFFYDYDKATMYNRTTGFVNINGEGFLPVGLAINGIEQQDWSQLEFVMCQDVQIQSVSKEASLVMRNAGGGHVVVKAFQGREFTKEMDPSTIYFVPLGYQEPQKFYSPRYDLGTVAKDIGLQDVGLHAGGASGISLPTKEVTPTDCRNTIYWSPMVKMGESGARINFCNSDLVDWPYIIHIEGVTDTGVPFSWRGLLEGSK